MTAELSSLDNDTPSDLIPHIGNMCDLLLALELLGCSGWLLGQEGEVPGCSDVGTDFLPAECSDGTAAAAAAEEAASSTGVGAYADAGDLA